MRSPAPPRQLQGAPSCPADDRYAADRYTYALQPSPGAFNETIFQTVDQILDSASRAGLRVIIAIIDNWQELDGVPSYLNWCVGASPLLPDNQTDYTPFYSNPKCISLVQNTIGTFLNRTNTVNGRVYRDDPTILAWDVLNEERCTGCGNLVPPWIDTIAATYHSLGPSQLVGVGGEGFFGVGDPLVNFNPEYPAQTWPQQTGQDFGNDTARPGIDYAGMHLWPDNWLEMDTGFAQQWVSVHATVAGQLGKPLIMEEFGKQSAMGAAAVAATRDLIFNVVYQALNQSVAAGGPLQGVLFWLWDARSEGTDTRSSNQGITSSDSTWQIISGTSSAVSGMPASAAPACTPLSSATAPAAAPAGQPVPNAAPVAQPAAAG